MCKHSRKSLRRIPFHKQRRGAILLELVLTIPFSLILIFIVVDVGRFVLASAALHDAVATAARTGARQGVIGGSPAKSVQPCGIRGDDTDLVYNAFCEAASGIPGATLTGFKILSPTTSTFCTVDDLFVTVAASADFDFLTDVLQRAGKGLLGIDVPGLGTIFENRVTEASEGAMGGTIYAVGTARCEVAR